MIIVTDMSHRFNLCLGITQLSCIDLGELLSHTTYYPDLNIHTCSRTFENWLQVGGIVFFIFSLPAVVTIPTDSHGIMNFT